MSKNICRNCGNEIEGNKCPNCGYTMVFDKPFKNVISNKEYKELIGDNALSLLMNNNLISKSELNHLRIEFGYLLYDEDRDILTSLIKVIIPKKMFHNQKIFYLGMSDSKLMLLDNDKFNDQMFYKVSTDMLTMHGVNMALEDKSKYIMELY